MAAVDLDDLRISLPRLRARIDALAEIGATPEGGNARLALTDADRDGRDLVVSWMHDLGARVDVDRIGNVTATWPPDTDAPAVMMGSHIDTVRNGGRYDGCLGVLAGLEVMETVIGAGVVTETPVAVAFFTDEEGSRFAPDMLGSLVFVGGLALEDALDTAAIDGARLGDELERIGYAGAAPCPARAPHAFLELHVEQGPVLQREATTIGAVTGVQGISWTECTFEGQSNHAGTTPMALRHDAGFVVAALGTALREYTWAVGPPLVGTIGRVECSPNLVNVVPGRAVCTVDLRHTDDAVLMEAEAWLAETVDALAAAEGVAVRRTTLARFAPVEFATDIVDLVERTACARGLSVMRLPSGAGHDAQMLARRCPAGMVFVPSAGGVSHNPAEHTDDADLAAGADVLLHTVLTLAGAR